MVMDTLENGDVFVDTRDAEGSTMLIIAAQCGNAAVAQLLLRLGADASLQNNAGATALHFSCFEETYSLELVVMLLDAGAPTQAVESSYGCTPLHYAASSGHLEIVQTLLNAGALPNAMDSSNYLPVDYARQAGHVHVVQCLEDSGVSTEGDNPTVAPEEGIWQELIDPVSGCMFRYNHTSGISEGEWSSCGIKA